jgi:Dolichyl-phosphate-mannose-protein mannosyltransferase
VSYRAGLVLLLLAGLVPRLTGLGWGLPGRSAPDEPPVHPDEHVVWQAAEKLYSAPPPSAFVYGGAFYARTGWLMRAGVHGSAAAQPPRDYAATLVGLRLLNAAAALVSAALLAAITRRLLGAAPALGAAALYLFFPVTVLDAHYARPDVLAAALTTASLAAAVAMARTGDRRWLALGGVCTGLATATLLSGVVGLAPLAVAALEWERGKAGARWWQSAFRAAPFAAGGALAGWLFGNLEVLLHLEAWRSGLAIASSSHNEGGWALPVAQLTRVSLYAFGSAAALAGYAGIPVLIASRAPGSLTVVAHLVFGYVLLARIGGDMMRHQEILAAPMALAAAAALAGAMRAVAGRRARAATVAALGLTAALSLQLSLTYVWPLQFSEDPRDRAGRWLVEHAPAGARVGITRSFHGDRTYAPRLPEGHRLRVEGLMLRHDFDAVDARLEYIATSDFARERAEGPTAPGLMRALFNEKRYRMVASFAPALRPFSLPDRLGCLRPGDLLYVRPTLYVFERRS